MVLPCAMLMVIFLSYLEIFWIIQQTKEKQFGLVVEILDINLTKLLFTPFWAESFLTELCYAENIS